MTRARLSVRDKIAFGLFALEFTLVVVGSTCLGWYAGTTAAIVRIRELDRAAFDQQRPSASGHAIEPVDSDAPEIRIVGELKIPRLNVFAPVERGDGEEVLQAAVGYLTDTPPPWEAGNSVLAAHRDGLFRPLERIVIGDEITWTTLRGEFTYRVLRTFLVAPSDTSVLRSAPHVNLTLITCYPFAYVGHAPQRFIVQAERISADSQ